MIKRNLTPIIPVALIVAGLYFGLDELSPERNALLLKGLTSLVLVFGFLMTGIIVHRIAFYYARPDKFINSQSKTAKGSDDFWRSVYTRTVFAMGGLVCGSLMYVFG